MPGVPTPARPDEWLLTAAERRNPSSRLYSGRPVQAWATGNRVRPLVDGATYFRRLCEELRATGAGDRVFFVDWRGDPDERLAGPGTAVMVELARAASAGAEVFGLVWRSHLDRFRFSEAENRNLAEALQAIRARVLLDMRVRRGGSHHQKFLVVRHPEDPSKDVAFVGGTDLGHSRNDDARHLGDPQPQPMSARYGPTPPWHDAMLEIRGPAVADVECCFRERWDDPTALRHARPWLWAMDRLRGLREDARGLPEPLPPPAAAGTDTVQLLRTYPFQKPAYPFAPHGERTVALGYAKALRRAERLVYVEDQYLWSREVAGVFADALRRRRSLRLVAVVPRYQDCDGRVQEPAQESAHAEAVEALREAGGDRVHLFDLENEDGTPIYVHAKVCVVDDLWVAVGSANLNRRSWTHDSELAAAVVSEAPGESLARRLRLQLWAEHLGRAPGRHAGLDDLDTAPGILDEAAARLDRWHADGGVGDRPAGRLRRHAEQAPSPRVRRAMQPFVEVVVDPDGRPWGMRHRHEW
jgi:phosphatidylserine/phosphatidylglycerophosphate/cardiolipin synthase-like enzyme